VEDAILFASGYVGGRRNVHLELTSGARVWLDVNLEFTSLHDG
jgi:hypothetical protein